MAVKRKPLSKQVISTLRAKAKSRKTTPEATKIKIIP